MIKYRRWMQVGILMVFAGYVMPIPFQMSHLIVFNFLTYDDIILNIYLHKETSNKCLAYIYVVVT
jgi:hypothetical protein